MKIKKCSFTTKLAKESKVVQGFRVGDSGLGFYDDSAVTKNQKFKWYLIHLQSGLRICQFKTQKRMKEYLPEIVSLTDWNQTQELLTKKNDTNQLIVNRLREIQNKVVK